MILISNNEEQILNLIKNTYKNIITYTREDLPNKRFKINYTFSTSEDSFSYNDELVIAIYYGKITEEEVRGYMDKEQFNPRYDSIYNMRREQTEDNARYLWLMAEQTPNFDRECIYTMELAHQFRYEEPHPVIPKLEGLMKSGKYSRYLHEVWRTWRCLKQLEISPSRDGMIPNLKYNKMRYRCMRTILRQIVKNPQDIYAINDFCFLATYDNIIRYSDFMFGNSAPLEQMMLFPEILMDNEEDKEE